MAAQLGATFEVSQEYDITNTQDSVDMVDSWSNHNDVRLNSENVIKWTYIFQESIAWLMVFQIVHLVNRYRT